MSNELKPCPFCGATGDQLENQGFIHEPFWVSCLVCGADGLQKDNVFTAMDAWNRRAACQCRCGGGGEDPQAKQEEVAKG